MELHDQQDRYFHRTDIEGNILRFMRKITNADTALTKEGKLTAMNAALERLINTTHTVEDWLGEEVTKDIGYAMHGIANEAITLAPSSLVGKHSILTAIEQRDFQPTGAARETFVRFMSKQKQKLTQLTGRSKNDGAIAQYKVALGIADQILEKRNVSQLPAFYDFYNTLISIRKEQHPEAATL